MNFLNQWFIQPFVYRAGSSMLLRGFLFMMVTAFIAMWSTTHFDGLVDAHVGWKSSAWIYFSEGPINWLFSFLGCMLAAKIITRKPFRAIDMAGTLAYARMPMLFVALLGFGVDTPDLNIPVMQVSTMSLIMAFLMLLFTVWMLILMYQAFSVSANVKGTKAIITFILIVILAEIVTKYIFYIYYSHFEKI